MTLQILAVRKDDDAITHLRGTKWEKTVEAVFGDIEAGRFRYIVEVDSRVADVFIAAATARENKHLCTTADTTTRNQLDRLPTF